MTSVFHPDAFEIRVRGRVQGVGFRPTVWRYANELGLSGEVLNDGDGVLIRVAGNDLAVSQLLDRLTREPPPLSRIEQVERHPFRAALPAGFRIAESARGGARTEVAPDAALCPECAREIADRSARRFKYAFTNCTHCGPRFSIVRSIPYDRSGTTMSDFELCQGCANEYQDPRDRRFHAEAIACPSCGPRLRLVRLSDLTFDAAEAADEIDSVAGLLKQGAIVALKGLGGYQLVCDATHAATVRRLRGAKHRIAKPFALMARDLDVIRRYCKPAPAEEILLMTPEAPIVLLQADGERLPDGVAPGLRTLGFMLPTTPLHALMIRTFEAPLVVTSGNVSDEPQVVDDDEALRQFSGIADVLLMHDRAIANRIDDSVIRVMAGSPRVLRRARGYAPAPIALPQGFERAPDLLALGGDLKSAFCLIKDGAAILSQHMGDLDDVETFDDYRRSLALYADLFDHRPDAIAFDTHPGYRSSALGRDRAAAQAIPALDVQHHHAHIAACLADNGRPLDAAPVLGIALDGLGWGNDGTIWGGEFLLADYRRFERVGSLQPVRLLGGDQAAREPWRNLYAHLTSDGALSDLANEFSGVDALRYLLTKPHALLEGMTQGSVNAPLTSSCGRLFDAVAAALDICRARQNYEGEAASRLEALVDPVAANRDAGYRFTISLPPDPSLPSIEPGPMWTAILRDLKAGTPAAVVAARFHVGLGGAIIAMVKLLMRAERGGSPCFDTVALSGGCFQNAILFEDIVKRLDQEGFRVLTHRHVPTNDGGLALGQATVAAARLIAEA